MAIASPSSIAVSVGIAALIAWRVYRRVRRSIGRQRLSRVRPWLTVTLLPALVALLLLGSPFHPASAVALAAGISTGAALGFYGLRLTRFESTPSGLFYTPNAHLGIALSLLLLARIAYRVIQVYASDPPVSVPPADFVRSPVTLAIFGTLAGYYVTYAVDLLRWRGRAGPSLGAETTPPSQQ